MNLNRPKQINTVYRAEHIQDGLFLRRPDASDGDDADADAGFA